MDDQCQHESPRLAFNTVLYRSGQLDSAVAEIAAAGYAGIELQPHLALPLLGDGASRGGLHRALRSRGLLLAAAMAGYLHDQPSLERNLAMAELLDELGGSNLLVLPPRPGMCGLGEFTNLLRQLASAAEPRGVVVAVHHHAGTIIDTPQAIDSFLDGIDGSGVGLCFDIAHYALFADDEATAAGRFAAAVRYVHVKDLARRSGALGFVPGIRNAQQSFRVAGDGVLRIADTLSALVEGGYRGWLSVEVENFYRTRTESAAVSKTRISEVLT